VLQLGKKKITTMRIDEELIDKAHSLGLNVSKISENAIKEAIERMEVVRK
jgi:post-segregation antitoxin (ccd killing protein)